MIELRKATAEATRYACLHFHYAKAVPSAQYSYNVYENGEWCGVIIFSLGANNHIGCPFGLVQGEVLELVRVALNGKQRTTSECVAAALKRLHADVPFVRAVVSYADKDQGHTGIIYQATNWFYLGLAEPIHSFIINGKKTHFKSIHSKYGFVNLQWIRDNVDPDAEDFTPSGKHKYVFFFDKKLRKQWAGKALPYPKQDGD
jgi:hypothetical protein